MPKRNRSARPKEKRRSSAGYSSEQIANRVAVAKRGGWTPLVLDHCDVKGHDLRRLLQEPGVERLQILYLSSNHLSSLPPEFGYLTALREIYLKNNQLTTLPPELGNLTALTSFSLGGNQLASLPPEFGNLTALTELNLQGNQLTSLPPELGNLTALTVLHLYDNKLASLPLAFGNLTALGVLQLDNNRLTSLPPEVGNLTALTVLQLGGNQLTSLPHEFGNLTALTVLSIRHNQLTSLPAEIGDLTALTELYLQVNQLTSLPPEFGNLTALTRLDISENQLASLPPAFGNLTALTKLYLQRNQLTALPVAIGQLAKLTRLQVSENPLPAELLRLEGEGKGKLFDYLRLLAAKQSEVRPFNEAKLLLIGPGEVGKTWLLQALQGNIPGPTESTKGIEIAREPLDIPHPEGGDRVIHFNCWDFAGQDHYQITQQIFFSPKAVYLLVWKPRTGPEPDLLERIERIKLSAGRTAKVFIVSTHADGPIPAIIGHEAIREQFGDIIGGFFAVDSAAGPNGTGIASLLSAIAAAAANLEGMDTPYPRDWHAARRAVCDTQETNLPFGRFQKICAHIGMTSSAAESLAAIMDEQGHAVYFSDAATDGQAGVSATENLVVLDPEWLAKAVAKVLEDKDTLEHSGVLQHERLPIIWADLKHSAGSTESCLFGFLLWLMWKFDIAYRLDDGRSLVPELIQRNRPDDLPWNPTLPSNERQATIICRIPQTPPPGLIPVLTAAAHPMRRASLPASEQIDPWDRNWRNGFFLDTPRRGTAFVELVDRELRLTARGTYPAFLLKPLRETLEKISKDRWPNLQIDTRIPCCGHVGDKPCMGSFRLSIIEGRRGETVLCETCNRNDIQVDHLLGGYDLREQRIMDLLRTISGNQQEALAVALHLYREILNPARPDLLRAPCMVSILPDEADSWNLLGKATHQHYRVTCWCEHPDGPHPGAMMYGGEPPDYRLNMPKEWLIRAAPYVSWLTMLAKTFVPMAGKVAEVGMGDDFGKDMGKHIALMAGLAGALPAGKLETGRRDEFETGSIYGHRPEIVALRHIHDALLAHVPEAKRWGALRPVQTKAHGLLWLCKQHADIQEPPVQQIPAEKP